MKATPSTRDALYFRVSSDRQTTENQFDELIAVACRDDNARNWDSIRADLAQCIVIETRTTPIFTPLTGRLQRLNSIIDWHLAGC